MPLQLADLAALDAPGPTSTGEPLLLPVADIDEDPDQPRREFDPESLQELAATIAERGVRQPVSVRRHPTTEGRWMLNFGARRLRASKLAGRAQIPAFVDEAADDYDQVIENEQRAGLRPLELALFVQRQLATGTSQAEVARRLGKSKAYISYVCALIDAPDWLLALYRSGRCTGAHELYDLRRLHAQQPHAIQRIINGNDSISRAAIESLHDDLGKSERTEAGLEPAVAPLTRTLCTSPSLASSSRRAAPAKAEASSKCDRPVRLFAEFEGRGVEVDLTTVPNDPGLVLVREIDGSTRRTLALVELTLLRLQR